MIEYKSKSGKVTLKSVEGLVKSTYGQTFFKVTMKDTGQIAVFRLLKEHSQVIILDSISQEDEATVTSTVLRCDIDSMHNANLPVMLYADTQLVYNVAKQFERYLFCNFSKRT